MYIASGQGQVTPGGQNFDVSRKTLSFCPSVVSFMKIPLIWDFKLFFFIIFPYKSLSVQI